LIKKEKVKGEDSSNRVGAMAEKTETSDASVSAVLDTAYGDVETSGFDAKAIKKLLRRLDWHIIPFMSLIYLYATTQPAYPQRGSLDPLTSFPGYAFSTEPTSVTPVSTTWNKIFIYMVYSTTIVLPSSSPSTSLQRYPQT
jgi:hypothetical protein